MTTTDNKALAERLSKAVSAMTLAAHVLDEAHPAHKSPAAQALDSARVAVEEAAAALTREPSTPSAQAGEVDGRFTSCVWQTAPERVWLQVDTDDDDYSRPFPDYSAGCEATWEAESIGGVEVEYVRADLATPSAQVSGGGEVEVSDLRDLLNEVRCCFTRDDDLPDDLLPRIDAALSTPQARPSQRVRHSCEIDMLSDCPGCEAESVEDEQARPDGGEAFAMLVAVAKAAHRAMDSGEELANHRVMLDALEASELTNALDAMDALPEIPDPHYVYDGWARAEYFARNPTPAPDAVARLVEAEKLLRRIRDEPSWRTNDNELWRDITAFTAAQQKGATNGQE